jgi:hypothetical protein
MKSIDGDIHYPIMELSRRAGNAAAPPTVGPAARLKSLDPSVT